MFSQQNLEDPCYNEAGLNRETTSKYVWVQHLLFQSFAVKEEGSERRLKKLLGHCSLSLLYSLNLPAEPDNKVKE